MTERRKRQRRHSHFAMQIQKRTGSDTEFAGERRRKPTRRTDDIAARGISCSDFISLLNL
jgi:hypothetical protein